MGFRIVLVIERDGRPPERLPTVLHWVVVGLVVIGVSTVLAYRALT